MRYVPSIDLKFTLIAILTFALSSFILIIQLFCLFYLNGIKMGQSPSIKATQDFIFEDVQHFAFPRTVAISQLSSMSLIVDFYYLNGKSNTLVGSIELEGHKVYELISTPPPYVHRIWCDLISPSSIFSEVRFPNGGLKSAVKPTGKARYHQVYSICLIFVFGISLKSKFAFDN